MNLFPLPVNKSLNRTTLRLAQSCCLQIFDLICLGVRNSVFMIIVVPVSSKRPAFASRSMPPLSSSVSQCHDMKGVIRFLTSCIGVALILINYGALAGLSLSIHIGAGLADAAE